MSNVDSGYELAAAIITDDLVVPRYRSLDAEDVSDVAYEEVLSVLNLLHEVDAIEESQKEFAAGYLGQFLLDRLAVIEAERIGEDLQGIMIVADTRKPYLMAIRVASDTPKTSAEVING